MKSLMQKASRMFVGDIWEEPIKTEPTESITEPLPTAKQIHKKLNQIRKEAAK